MHDARDCPVSTASTAALAHAEKALWRSVTFYGDAVVDFDAAIAADPGWGLAHVAKVNFLLSLTEPALLPQARDLLAAAAPLMAHANPRERRHFDAAACCAAGHWRAAGDQWEQILLRHPRDLLALNNAHLFDFYRGDAHNLRERIARVLTQWPATDALRPHVLGMYAFGLEECHQHTQAEAIGRAALDRCAQMPWAIHAVAYVMEMQGRHREGVAWLRTRQPDWAVDNGLAVHLWWHLALFQIETLDTTGALQLFDDHLSGAASVVNLQWLDGAALLWRLQLLGVPTGTRWQRLAADWADPVGHAGYCAFNDCHALLALLGSGETDRAQALLDAATARAEGASASVDGCGRVRPPLNQRFQSHLEKSQADAPADNHAIAVQVGLPLMRGLMAFAAGDAARAVRTLDPLRRIANQFGGSHAQRDLIDQTVLAAACACAADSAEHAIGHALLSARGRLKPSTPLTRHWAARLGAAPA